MALEDLRLRLSVDRAKMERLGPLLVDRMADALIEELNARVPGPETNPLNTGTMRKALTKRTAPYRIGTSWAVGIGDNSLLGTRGAKDYVPEPIKRFLKWYQEDQAKGQAEKAAFVQRKAAERVAYRKAQDARELKAYAQVQTNRAQQNIIKLRRAIRDLDRKMERLDGHVAYYNDLLVTYESKGYDMGKPSYQRLYQRRDALMDRMRGSTARREAMMRELKRLTEALMLYRRRYGTN